MQDAKTTQQDIWVSHYVESGVPGYDTISKGSFDACAVRD